MIIPLRRRGGRSLFALGQARPQGAPRPNQQLLRAADADAEALGDVGGGAVAFGGDQDRRRWRGGKSLMSARTEASVRPRAELLVGGGRDIDGFGGIFQPDETPQLAAAVEIDAAVDGDAGDPARDLDAAGLESAATRQMVQKVSCTTSSTSDWAAL